MQLIHVKFSQAVLTVILLFCLAYPALSQVPNSQDCMGAHSVCQSVYQESQSYSGTGNYNNEINPAISCLAAGEKNDVWYQMTVTQSGNLSFVITPNNLGDDYDWAVYNLTNANCSDIATNPALQLSCNYSATSGATGANLANGANNQGASGTPKNKVIPVTAGQTIVLNVSNFSSTQSGFTLNFSQSTAAIYDTVKPRILSITPTCNSQFNVKFSENILCSSITGSDFTVTGPGGPYTATIIASTCLTGSPSENDFTFAVSPPFAQSGTYTITQTGVITDNCGNSANSGNATTFNVTAAASLGRDTAICPGKSITLNATTPGATSYLWNTGATSPTISVNTSGTYIVRVVVNSCTIWDTINITSAPLPTIVVSAPPVCTGTRATLSASGASVYSWSGGLPNGATVTTPVLYSNTSYTVTGTDANGCTNTAVANVVVNAPPVVITDSATICAGQTATLHASGASTYSWSGGLPAGSTTTTPALTITTRYTVIGTDATGCADTATALVTVLPSPNVRVNSPTVCVGQSALLVATGAASYAWSGGLPPNDSVNTPALNSTSSFTVTGIGANGCSSSAVATVTVDPVPNVTVISPVICYGNSATLTASGASTYTWSGGLPNGATVSTPPLTAITSYIVTGTDANGCVDTATATVSVNALPPVSVTSPVICSGQSATITASGATTYSWSGGLAPGANVSTPTLTSTTSYTVTGTAANGCQNTAVSTVTVNNLPNVSVNSPAICFGDVANLTASGAVSYTWSGGLPNGASVTTPVLTAPASYIVTGTDASGCMNTATANVTLYTSPVVNVTNPVICAGQSATITATGATTYSWSGGLAPGSVVTTPALASSTSYTVIGANPQGCKDTAISVVTVNLLPSIVVNSPSICFGQSAALFASGASTYTWSGGLPNGSNVNTPVLTASANYTVTGTDVNSCQNTATAAVTVNSLPVVTVNNPEICQNETAVLSASGAVSYTWTGGLGNAATVTTPALTATTSFDVTGTDARGCMNQARSIVTVYPVKTTNLVQVICQGESITIGPRTFNSSGTYSVNLLTSSGCDSIVNLDLTVNPVKTTNLRQTICEGQFATIGGQTFPQSGVYTVKLQTSRSCDSTVILDLTVNPLLPVAVTAVSDKNDVCYGDLVTFTATPSYPGSLPQYQWYVNNAPVGGNSPVFSSSTLNDSDEVFVQLVSSEACVLINPAFSEKVPMTVYRLDYTKPYIEYCSGQTPVLDLNIPQSNYAISWNNGLVEQLTRNVDEVVLSNTESGYIDFTIRFGNNCTHRDSVTITVNPLPVVTLQVSEDTVRYGTEVQLNGTIDDPSNTFSWSPDAINDPNVLDPTAVILASNWYTLEATDDKGCRKKDSVFIALLDDCLESYIYIPSAFSPNQDGLNDCFSPVDVAAHTEYKLIVFNRWGEKMFEAQRADQCWDGRYKGVEVPIDTYPFVIAYRCHNGKVVEKHGILTLVR